MTMRSLDNVAQLCFELEYNAAPRKYEYLGCILVPSLAFGGMLVATVVYEVFLISEDVFPILAIGGGVVGWLLAKAAQKPDAIAVPKQLALFRTGHAETTRRVHQFAVTYFREQIRYHRSRTLGEQSEWGKARSSLAATMDEARQQKVYWHGRWLDDKKNDMALRQYETASHLRDKMSRALDKLDSRADVLLGFYAECETRVDSLDHNNQDMVKTRELESLSDRMDVVVAEAEGTLTAIAQDFVREVDMLWQAMSGLGEMQTLALAGEASLDNMELLADRVIEQSEMDEKTMQDLERSLQQKGG